MDKKTLEPIVDWESIHNRLADFAAAITAGNSPDPEKMRLVLETRARAAAIPPPVPDASETLELLTFLLAGESYGVETRYVREVCRLVALTQIPCAPAYVAGLMNLRGRILMVCDLGKFFGLPSRGLSELNRVIILSQENNELGLLADSIEDVLPVTVADLQEGLPTLTGIREEFLKGVTGQSMAVLDSARLLACTEF